MALYLHSENVTDNPLAYLHTVLRNKVINYYARDKSRLAMTLPLDDTLQVHSNNIVDGIAVKELTEKIRQILERLPDQCRRVFVLSREEQLSNKEIAERLGISVKTVEQHMTKALRVLRENLDYHLLLLFVVVYGSLA